MHVPVSFPKLLPQAFSGNECVGAGSGLGLGKKRGPQRVPLVHAGF